jgi:hypothetical protein
VSLAPRLRAAIDAAGSTEEVVELVLQHARSRGAIKRLGSWLDGPGSEFKAALAARGSAAVEQSGKRLIRAALARTDAAQVRHNPVHRREDFTCSSCERDVTGSPTRDHCPYCLCSLHVDRVPGDRAAGCGGVMRPVAVSVSGAGAVLAYRCLRCGADHRVRAAEDDAWPLIVALSATPRQ